VSTAFTPRAVRDMEPLIREIVRTSLDRLAVGDPIDVVEAISVPVSINVIAAMLGVPREDWDEFRRATDAFVAAIDAVPDSEEAKRMQAAIGEFLEYLDGQLALRRVEPRDDLMTAITLAEIDGERLSGPLQVQFCFNLLAAGNETTRNTISGATVAFAEHPDQWTKIVTDRALATKATEEILRWTTVFHSFVRTATRDTTIRGQRIRRGDFVAMFYPAANRDEDHWERADQFDVTRDPKPTHATFGVGPHFCLGAGLARLETRIVLEELAARFARVEITGDVVRLPSTVVDRYGHVPALLAPRD
jgi:cytochrome P450